MEGGGVGQGAADQGHGVFFAPSCAKHRCWWAGPKPPPSQPPHATALASLTLLLGGSRGAWGAGMLPQRVVILEVQVPFLYMLPDSKLSGGKSSTLYALLLRAVA